VIERQLISVKISLATLILVAAVLLSGLVDLPTRLSLGPISSLALLTIVYAVSTGILLLARPALPRSAVGAGAAFMAFVVWALLSFTWYHAPTGQGWRLLSLLAGPGVQNMLVAFTFVGFIILASYESYHSYKFPWLIQRTLVRATWIAMGLFAITFLGQGGLETMQDPQTTIIGPRVFAAFALLGLAWYLSVWRYGSRRGLFWAIVITLVIALSLSRTALIVATIMWPLAAISLRSIWGWVRVSLVIVVIGGSMYFALTYIEPLHSRFFEGDTSLQVGGTMINAEGRSEAWELLSREFAESPVVGKGAGSSDELIAAEFGEGLGHAHQEYLRLLHDYGLVGAVLWLLGFAALLWTIWRAWQKADRTGDVEAPLHLAALLALFAIAAVMTTDNPAIYIFIMAPLGALVGASLGRTRYD
jgi:O-antigen ligase